MTRKSKHTATLPETKQRIIDWLYEGKSILAFCELPGSPARRSIYEWCDVDPEFGAQFTRAREVGAGVLIDMAQKVADDGSNDYREKVTKSGEVKLEFDSENVQRSKLRVETLFRRAACYCPRLYGTRAAIAAESDEAPREPDRRFL
jgi:hypothetical protein